MADVTGPVSKPRPYKNWAPKLSAAAALGADQYSDLIDRAVADLNQRMANTPGYKPLDPKWVRAIMTVETANGSAARQYDPMQVANAGDHALTVLQKGGNHSALIDPTIAKALAGTSVTPWHHKTLNYDGVAADKRITAEQSIRAGVTWLALNAAQFGEVHVEDKSAPTQTLTVKANDNLWEIAKRNGTTVESLQALNGKVLAHGLHPGDSLEFRPAHKEMQITGWQSWETAAKEYNGGGDKHYLDKVKANHEEIVKDSAPKKP